MIFAEDPHRLMFGSIACGETEVDDLRDQPDAPRRPCLVHVGVHHAVAQPAQAGHVVDGGDHGGADHGDDAGPPCPGDACTAGNACACSGDACACSKLKSEVTDADGKITYKEGNAIPNTNTDGSDPTDKTCPPGAFLNPGARNFNFAGQADLIDPCPSPAPPPPSPPKPMPSRLVTVEDIVLGVNIAASVLGVTSLLGLGLACARRGGCAHNFFGGLYFVASIPVWVALGFVCAFALAFRDEAELLVGQYWNCLRTARTTDAVAGGRAWEVAAAVYESITITAALLLGADLLLLLGLYAAGGLIGWSKVSANLLAAVNTSTAVIGATLRTPVGTVGARI